MTLPFCFSCVGVETFPCEFSLGVTNQCKLESVFRVALIWLGFCLQVQLQAQTLEKDKAWLVSSGLASSVSITSAPCKHHHLCPDVWRDHVFCQSEVSFVQILKMPLLNNKWWPDKWMSLAFSFWIFFYLWGGWRCLGLSCWSFFKCCNIVKSQLIHWGWGPKPRFKHIGHYRYFLIYMNILVGKVNIHKLTRHICTFY